MVFNPMGTDKEGGGHKLFFVGGWYEDELVRTDDGWRIAKRYERKAFLESMPSA
jgi:hypothetical protein